MPTIRTLLLQLAVAVVLLLPQTVDAQSSRIVVLVRHAEAGGEPVRDPQLTARGTARAEALAAALADADVRAVVVSSLARTRLTADPLLRATGIEPIVVDVVGGIDRHVARVAEAVRAQPPGATVLVVGHSNTVPAIVTALGGPDMADLCHGEFAGLFVLQLSSSNSELLRGRYGDPDADDARACREPGHN